MIIGRPQPEPRQIMNDSPPASATVTHAAAGPLALNCTGADFWALDRGLRDLVGLYLEPAARTHLEPHLALRQQACQLSVS